MVRLKGGYVSTSTAPVSNFQFQSGAVKRINQLGTLIIKYIFNSKVVRLKDAWQCAERGDVPNFQFQSGAVKSSSSNKKIYATGIFQFQSGAVKS